MTTTVFVRAFSHMLPMLLLLLLCLLPAVLTSSQPCGGTCSGSGSVLSSSPSLSSSWMEKVNAAFREFPEIMGDSISDVISDSDIVSNSNGGAAATGSVEIDEHLYSRQLFVYGKTAQRKLMAAHVAVLGHDCLAEEVLKNLVLAGVGRISLIRLPSRDHEDHSRRSISSQSANLVDYLKSLNNHVQVR
jgi:hypothetical protein